MIDYRLLLKKYMNYLSEIEGCDFTETFNPEAVSVGNITEFTEKLTDEDIKELIILSKENQNEYI